MTDDRTQLPAVTPSKQIIEQRNSYAWEPVVGGRGQLAATSGTLYTAPTKSTPIGSVVTSILTSIVFNNTDSSARTVTIYLIESGGSVADNRAMLKTASIPATTQWTWDCGSDGIPLADTETVRGLASVANVVTYRVNVKERV